MKKEYSAVDYTKLFFAAAIVTLHVPSQDAVLGIFAQYIARMGVPFFFVVSGFFLYSKLKNGDERTIIKRYLLRLARLFGVWLIIYSPFLILRPMLAGGFSMAKSLTILQEIVFKTPAYLWYLAALMVGGWFLYLFRKHLTGFLMLSIILYCLGALGNTYVSLLGLEEVWSGYFQIFLTTRNGVFFAPLFVCLGAVLKEYGDKVDRLTHPVLIEVALFIVYILEVTLVGASGVVFEDRSFYFTLPFVVAGLVHLLMRVKWESGAASGCRRLSTWIYCSQFGFLTGWQMVTAASLGRAVDGFILWLMIILAQAVVYFVLDSNKYSRKLLKYLI